MSDAPNIDQSRHQTISGNTIDTATFGDVHIQHGPTLAPPSELTDTVRFIYSHLENFPQVDRADVKNELDDIQEAMARPKPQKDKITTRLNAIGRIAKAASMEAVRSSVEGAVRALAVSLWGG
jgi:hypothetical protein